MSRNRVILLCLAVAAAVYLAAQAGNLEPPGPPAPTMVTLDQIDSKLNSLVAGGSLYQFVGVTAASTLPTIGWKELGDICQAEFGPTYPNVRMCKTVEIMNTPLSIWPTWTGQAWVAPVVVAVNGNTNTWLEASGNWSNGHGGLSCAGWTDPGQADGWGVTPQGKFGGRPCTETNFVSCCAFQE